MDIALKSTYESILYALNSFSCFEATHSGIKGFEFN
jgi:hypothetical protein